ncbi:NAD(P)/FAD-dependent oxidoreductase [Amphritea sp. 1_MG-2023]|uniref:NAD(P)/FAD-dependent oxidoreductase n=1 Tax=Amphritea sp. 1_MG-2023 TaxID=3062670 RepID=UPI0026E3D9B5|nr:NAD(P)/FAD-dependent oxidoreductase [Amphritea sp. 1_MG-2023]MDO6562461.1 NAD(P)/FAD-dependent oxidoreductase [Amphritea sp. 1_MG-2023]
MQQVDVVIVGAGASGLMCAATAGYRGRSVLVLEHSAKIGRKILMSGGGRCNFTNIHNSPANFISQNPHFCKSALSRYSAQDFIDLVDRHGVEYHEKTLGQLFCNESSKEILRVLMTECEWAGVEIKTNTEVHQLKQTPSGFQLQTSHGNISATSVVIATGGLSIPNGGATSFAYDIATEYGLTVLPRSASLVPFTLQPKDKEVLSELSGVSHQVKASIGDTRFVEMMLFTHRGLSGPAILQISNYWQPGEEVEIDLFPHFDLLEWLKEQRDSRPKADITTIMAQQMSKRMAQVLCGKFELTGALGNLSNKQLEAINTAFRHWRIKPSGTEGYRTAEVTLGGIDTDEINQKTMQAKKVEGLYFIGECLDVTGHLGGHNFQWAWASGVAAGQVV